MPMQRELYPPNWDAIALAKKESVGWHCENCDRPCRISGESLYDFILRIEGEPHPDLDWVNQAAISTICEKPQRWTLTVAHLNQEPSDCSDANLKALCAPCHLEHDRPFRLANRARKLERQGQLNLLRPPAIAPIAADLGRDPTRIQPTLWS
ncbi:hypothetical protein [Pseudanabaena sp. FACHB-2040]|uniref:hypothetical protein n=1 Tax=Pseudanabaena sp. FACHB-2040 TaxID=2692859 RepID=UPI0016859179|nr:hypothetical protein [Pseudanabaena sp. FACHB-2040]MBD2261408.1 hypothetical protein [Pseudanabaena sp. FACHB-2040]